MAIKTFIALVPDHLDFDQLLRDFPSEYELRKEFLYYIVHYILTKNKQTYRYDRDIIRQYGKIPKHDIQFDYKHVPLSSRKLQAVIKDYKRHMDWLYKARVLDKQGYKEGRCYSYRLNYSYQRTSLKYVVIENRILKKNIRKQWYIHKDCSPKLKALKNHIEKELFTVDVETALTDLEGLMNTCQITYGAYMLSLASLMEIHNGTIWMSQNMDTDGRLHTSLTQLPKIARKYLRYKGERLLEIDLTSSVPFFLYTLLDGLSISDNSIIESNRDTISIYHTMLEESAESLDPIELQDFRNLVLTGGLYDKMGKDFKRQLGTNNLKMLSRKLLSKSFKDNPTHIREIAKRSIMAILFSKNSEGSYMAVKECFTKRFPTIAHWLFDFKKEGDITNHHKTLAHVLFQIESTYMLHKIAKAFSKAYRVPIFSLHDCLIVTESRGKQLLGFMQNVFLQELGVCPSMKMEYWNAQRTVHQFTSPNIRLIDDVSVYRSAAQLDDNIGTVTAISIQETKQTG